MTTTTQTPKHEVKLSTSDGKTVITIRNKQGFGMHWMGNSAPSELELDKLIDIHKRTYAGHMRIN